MKKSFCLLLITTILVGLITPAVFAGNASEDFETNFIDMPDDWSAPALRRAVANGLLRGAGGKIMPNSNLTRAEMAAVIVRAFGAVATNEMKSFDDVHTDDWFAEDIAKAYQMGVMRGTGQKMNPKTPITREEVFVIFARALKLKPEPNVNRTFTDIGEVSLWAEGEVYAMVNNGYVHGSNGRLNPKGLITRAEFSQLLDNLIKQYLKTGGVVTSVADGNILVSVPGVHMKNLTVNGDLIIGDGVGEGDIILEDVKVKGRLVVRGGGKNSIIIRGKSEVSEVILCRSDGVVCVKVMDGSDVEEIYVDDGSDDVYLEGNINRVTIESDDISVTARSAKIHILNIRGNRTSVMIDKNSVVNSIYVKLNTENNEIDVAGTVLEIATASRNTHIGGTGKISVVSVVPGGNDTTVSSAETRVIVWYGVTNVFCGETEIQQGTTITTNLQGTGIVTPTPHPQITPKPSRPSPMPSITPTPKPTTAPLPPGNGGTGGGGSNNSPGGGGSGGGGSDNSPGGGGSGGGGSDNPPSGGGTGDLKILVASVTVQPSSITMMIGQTAVLTAFVMPNNASDRKISWHSSDINTATINDSGVVTALAPGTATITATTNDGGKTASCTVTILQKEPVANVSVLESMITIATSKKNRATIGNEVGQFTQESVDKLGHAIKGAQAVLQNTDSTQAQIDTAADALKEAIFAFDFSMIIPADNYILSVFSLPEEGTVTVSDAVYQDKIAVTDAVYYPIGQSISISAAPNKGYSFAGWLKEGIKINDNPYIFTMPQSHVAITSSFRKNNDYDTFILRKDAAFNVKLTEDIYWVPVNILGAPEHSRDEIYEMIARGDPQYIKSNINTLYDAIQYYYLSSFRVLQRGEHIDINVDGVYWQTHKSGVEALMTNEGDCSGISALLRYLLEGDYDDVGYLSYHLPDGTGHVFNYIKEGDSYYFIDLFDIYHAFAETGTPAGIYFGGNLVKAPSIQKYAEFYRSLYYSGIALFSSHSSERVSPIGFRDGTYYFPDNIQYTFYPTEVNVPRVVTRGPAVTPVWKYGALPVIEPVTAADIEILAAPDYAYYDYTKKFTGTLYFSLKRHGHAEMTSITLDYYTPQNQWVKQEIIRKEDISKINVNNFLMNRSYYFLPKSNDPFIIKGKAFFQNVRKKEIVVEFTMDYTRMMHYVNQGIQPSGGVIPSLYDRQKLKYNASYKVPVGNGVFWVPVNTLGKPQLTGEQIRAVPKTPQTLKQKINTLYDAIAFVQEYGMSGEDRKFLSYDNTLWEYYQSIEQTVSTNLGGSGEMANLLCYLLQDDYDEVGYIVYSSPGGEYEIQNYICENGKFYIINLKSYQNEDKRLVPETGSYWDLPDHIVAGCLFEVGSPQHFAEYIRANTGTVPEFIAAYTDDKISPMGRKSDTDKTRIYFPEELRQKLIIIYDNPKDRVSYEFIRLPF